MESALSTYESQIFLWHSEAHHIPDQERVLLLPFEELVKACLQDQGFLSVFPDELHTIYCACSGLFLQNQGHSVLYNYKCFSTNVSHC